MRSSRSITGFSNTGRRSPRFMASCRAITGAGEFHSNARPANRPTRAVCPSLGENVPVRKLLIAVFTTILVVTGGAVAADFGTTIYAEYRLARTVRHVADLSFDPSVAILGFSLHPSD